MTHERLDWFIFMKYSIVVDIRVKQKPCVLFPHSVGATESAV